MAQSKIAAQLARAALLSSKNTVSLSLLLSYSASLRCSVSAFIHPATLRGRRSTYSFLDLPRLQHVSKRGEASRLVQRPDRRIERRWTRVHVAPVIARPGRLLRRWSEYGEHEQPLGASIPDAVRRSFGRDQQDSRLHGNLIALE